MSQVKVAEGHDVALVSLNNVTPRPQTRPVRPTERRFSAAATVHDFARYVELVWNVLDVATYQSILAQFGLDAALQCDVTVYVRDDTLIYTRWNGVAVRPEPGRDFDVEDGFPKRITMRIVNLEPSS